MYSPELIDFVILLKVVFSKGKQFLDNYGFYVYYVFTISTNFMVFDEKIVIVVFLVVFLQ